MKKLLPTTQVASALVLMVGALGVTGVTASAASAQSTTVSTAGHSLSLVAREAAVAPTGFEGGCLVGGGAAQVPNAPGNHNASGAVTVSFSTPVSFSSCSLKNTSGEMIPYSITTGGTWTVALQYGASSTATFTVPTGGFAVVFPKEFACEGSNASPAVWKEAWQNGSSSPFVLPTVSLGGVGNGITLTLKGVAGKSCVYGANGTKRTFSISSTPFSVDDTTNGSDLISVTP